MRWRKEWLLLSGPSEMSIKAKALLAIIALSLTGCGNSFSVYNDGAATVDVDIIAKATTRGAKPVAVRSGEGLTGHLCRSEVDLVIIRRQGQTRTFNPSRACPSSDCHCSLNLSEIGQ